MRFWDLKISQNWKFALTGLTNISITRSIFDIEGSSFRFDLIFVCLKIHILQLKLSDQIFNDLTKIKRHQYENVSVRHVGFWAPNGLMNI